MENQNVTYPVTPQKAPKNLRRKFATLGAGAGTAFMTTLAKADIDVSQLTTKIDAQTSNVETIGLAILGVLIVIAGIALLRRVIH